MTSVLVNVAGFLLGGVLYGLLLAMAAASRSADGRPPDQHGGRWREPFKRPLVWAGMLGLIWNLGAFLAYGFPGIGSAPLMPLVMALSFSALGFLPAVVVHVVMGGAAPASGGARAATAAAYTLSTLAAALHVSALLRADALPARSALDLLTFGFLALLVPLLILTRRARHGRAVWIVALALFGVSALHLTQHTGRDAWWVEVLGHQGSLLLPVAILLRDYRFAFADLFLKRALGLSLMVCLVAAVHVGLRRVYPLPTTEAALAAYVLTLTVLTALLHRRVQRAASWLVDKIVLGRVDYDDAILALEADLAPAADEAEVLARAARRVAESLGSISVETVIEPEGAPSARPLVRPEGTGLALTTIPTVGPPYLAWRLGHLTGERRLLSDDMRVLESAASMVGRRVDGLRVASERLAAAVRAQEVSRLATEAELRALRAQIDPHFLFNALTTIAYLIRSSPAAAESTLRRLTTLLRAVLRRTRSEFTTLGDELELVESYLEIERARFEERLTVTVDVPASLLPLPIPSLLLQPLVENAVKHGIAPLAAGGHVSVVAVALPSETGGRLRLTVHDTGTGASEAAWAHGRTAGVGLATLQQRLSCHFGDAATLTIASSGTGGTTVRVELPTGLVAPASQLAAVSK